MVSRMIPDEKLPETCRAIAAGDEDAAQFLVTLAGLVRLADDIADGDADEPHARMADLLFHALIYLPNNAFYLRHQQALSGVLFSMVFNWLKSEDWRHVGDQKTRMFAFVLRETVDDVARLTAFITGGAEHARKVADMLHREAHIEGNPETFEMWDKET